MRGDEQKYLETLPDELRLPRAANRLKLQMGASRVAREAFTFAFSAKTLRRRRCHREIFCLL